MLSTRLTFLAAAVLMLIGSAAHAADYPQPIYTQPEPQPIIVQPPPVVDCCDGWYLRGHLGVGMVSASQMRASGGALGGSDFRMEHSAVTDAYFIGGGVGYEWNNWLRLEATAEYRAKMKMDAFGSYTVGCPIGVCLDQYQANLKSYLFLINAFVDLGTWNCFTPFVGLGVGAAYNQITDFNDVNVMTGGRGFGRDTAEWNFAWALYAGVAYNVTKSFKIEFSYRYLDLGAFADTIDCVGGCGALRYHIDKVTSHDFMIGFRWACCDIPAVAPPVVYAPPPPPLLRSKG